jgi:ABC-type branched-subunit amino acid transport system permease subunit
VPSQTVAIVGGVALVVVLAALGSLMSASDLVLVTKGAGIALVTLSLVPLTGYAGQISLAQMTFVGIGAVAMAAWGASGSPLAVVLVVAVCAVVGAVVALPALRLSGIYLALATAAFALFCTAMFFNQQTIIRAGSVQVPPLSFGPLSINTDFRQLVLTAIVFALLGNGLVWLRRSAWGRRLTAMKDSPVACATLGLNLTSTKVGVFALSAAIAGAGGAMSGRTFTADSFSLPASLPVTMLAVVGGIGSIAGAFIGGMLLGAIPIASTIFAANAIGIFRFVSLPVTNVLSFTPGLMGISLGREPDGAAPQIAVGYRAVGDSPPALVVSAAGAVALWVATRVGVITKWSFFAALVVFVVAVVPLLPLILTPRLPEDQAEPPRRVACAIWLALATIAAVLIPWATAITSNGVRVLLVLVLAALSARVAIGVLGVTPEQLRRPLPPSPDLIGVDRPLSRADAIEATHMMGLTEDEFEAEVSRAGADVAAAPVGALR